LGNDGLVWGWGRNVSGQLGGGDGTSKSFPAHTATGTYVVISAGESYSLALKANGEAWAWGSNLNGELGNNSATPATTPVQVVGGHSFTALSAGSSYIGGGQHSLGLKANGEAWAWGLNTGGQLGDNTLTSKSSPIQVVGGHSFIAIKAGNGFSIALKANGEVWGWGVNINGQLGNNSTTSTSSPVQSSGGHSFIKISTGFSYTIALKSSGQAWAWGRNSTGQLGDNTTTGKSSPIQVVGGHLFTDIGGGGGEQSMGLKASGQVWCWGYNGDGTLGDNTLVGKSSPVQVVGGHSFIQISDGGVHCLALKANGEIWAWGRNATGQLGDGTFTSPRSSPVYSNLTLPLPL